MAALDVEGIFKKRPSKLTDEKAVQIWLMALADGWNSSGHKTKSDFRRQFPTLLGVMASSLENRTREASRDCLNSMVYFSLDEEELQRAAQGESSLASWTIQEIESKITSLEYSSNPLSLPCLLEVLIHLAETKLQYRLPLQSLSQPRHPPLGQLLMTSCFSTLIKLREFSEENKFDFGIQVEATIGTLINICGIEWTLSVVELGLGLDKDIPERTWLLNLFHKYASGNERLGHFTTFWMDQCHKIHEIITSIDQNNEDAKLKNASSNNRVKLKAALELLLDQIFAVFPQYCSLPVDVEQEFSNNFLNALGNILYSRPSARPSIINGLSLLIKSFTPFLKKESTFDLSLSLRRRVGYSVEQVQSLFQKDGALGSQRAMSILGVLANLYGKLPPGSGYVLECVEIWLGVLDDDDTKSTYTRITTIIAKELQKPIQASTNTSEHATISHSMFDFLIAMAGSVSNPALAVQILEWTTELLLQRRTASTNTVLSQDRIVEKKLYRIMTKLATRHRDLIRLKLQNDPAWAINVIDGGENVSNAAKKERIAFLNHLVDLLSANSLHVILNIIPEAVLGTKEGNEKTREASFSLLVRMGEKMGQTGGFVKKDAIGPNTAIEVVPATVEEYLSMVSSGLTGTSSYSLSATIISLSRLLFEFHASLSPSAVDTLLSTIYLFLESKNREIIKATVGFVKVSIVCLPAQHLTPHLPSLIPNLFRWSHEHKNHLKANIRHIIERAIRKFGINKIESLIPEEDKKLLANIKKRQASAKRKKSNAKGESVATVNKHGPVRTAFEEALYDKDDTDSDSEDRRPHSITTQQTHHPILLNDDDDPLDLLDGDLITKVSLSSRSNNRQRKAPELKTADDGRVIVSNMEDTQADENPNVFEAYLEATQGESGLSKNERGKVKMNKTVGKKRVRDSDIDQTAVDVGRLEISKRKKSNNHGGNDDRQGKGSHEPYRYISLKGARKGGKQSPFFSKK